MAEKRQTFRVERGDMYVHAFFEKPRFHLLGESRELFAAFDTGLGEFGLVPSHMSVAPGFRGAADVSPGDWTITCSLYAHSSTIRLKVDRLELECSNTERVVPDRLIALFIRALHVVADHSKIPFKAFNWNLGLHGVVEGTAARDFTSRFVADPPAGLGSLLGSAAVFYYGLPGNLASSVTVDLSAWVENGVFLRTYATWDAAKVEIDALPNEALAFRDSALAALGLQLPE